MSHAPTDEQQAIIDSFGEGGDLVIDAAAGSGKTSTLKMLAKADKGRRGVYIAYSKAIADEAQRDFPDTVTCKTSHALAFGDVGRTYRHRLNGSRLPLRESLLIMGINEPLHLGTDVADIPTRTVGQLVSQTIRNFCFSGDAEIQNHHVPRVNGIDKPAQRDELAKALVPMAQRIWDTDISRPSGRLRFEHDHYLKLWALTNPRIDADYVLLDEAQDSNGCVSGVVGKHNGQRIMVGDRCQSIYGWRGATDAMEHFTGKRHMLSQSFRFGPAIAAEANKWLRVLDADLRVRGDDKIPSRLTSLSVPDAVLCRTNAVAVRAIADELERGQRVALVGGGAGMIRLAEAAADLMAGERTSHPDLCAFTSWDEVQQYVQEDSAGADLQVTVNLIDKYGPDGLIALMRRLVAENRAQIVVSTAHKSKGREWGSVRIAEDFPEPKKSEAVPNPEISRPVAMLAYVAVTRTQHLLDRAGLAWVDNWA